MSQFSRLRSVRCIQLGVVWDPLFPNLSTSTFCDRQLLKAIVKNNLHEKTIALHHNKELQDVFFFKFCI